MSGSPEHGFSALPQVLERTENDSYGLESVQLPPEDIFVSPDKEEEYLRDHNIIIEEVNGATIFAATLEMPEAASSKIDVEIPYASCYEKIPGATHFLEHLKAKRPHELAKRVGLTDLKHHNAGTDYRRVAFWINGPASMNATCYGVFPVTALTINEITTPLSRDIIDFDVETEKEVIKTEIEDRDSSFGMQVYQARSHLVLSPDNPQLYDPVGKMSDIHNISSEDILEAEREVFNSNGMEVSIYSHGSPQITQKLVEMFKSGIVRMPRGESEPMPIDETKAAELNPKLKPGYIYRKDLGFSGCGYVIDYVLNLPRAGSYSTENLAQLKMAQVLLGELETASRALGLCYGSEKAIEDEGLKRRFMQFSLYMRKVENVNDVYTRLWDYVQSKIGSVDTIHERLMVEEEVSFVRTEQRLKDARKGHKTYGRIIDSDKIDQLYRNITRDDLQKAYDEILDTAPSTFVIGDGKLITSPKINP